MKLDEANLPELPVTSYQTMHVGKRVRAWVESKIRAHGLACARAGALAALDEAAKVCEKRADDRSHDEGSVDPSTGTWEGPEWVITANEEDDDCAAAIRRLRDTIAKGEA